MPRNFLRRIEVMCPIEDTQLKRRLLDEVLGLALLDNQKARRLQPDGSYVHIEATGDKVRSQQSLLEAAKKAPAPDPIRAITSVPA
jgi:polyphosphate kinase